MSRSTKVTTRPPFFCATHDAELTSTLASHVCTTCHSFDDFLTIRTLLEHVILAPLLQLFYLLVQRHVIFLGFKLLELAATYALMTLAERNSAFQAKFDFALRTGDDSQAFVYVKYKTTIGS